MNEGKKVYDRDTLRKLANSSSSQDRPAEMPNISGFTLGIQYSIQQKAMDAITISQNAKQTERKSQER